MTNEKWWQEKPYMTRGPYSDYYHFEKIVAEAMRLGEVKAWEEAKKLVTASTPNHLARDYRETDAMRDAINGLINTKLTELKK